MKKMIFLSVCALLSFMTASAQQTLPNYVTATEYKSMSELEKRLNDYLSAAASGLKGLRQQDAKGYADYQGTVSISKNATNKMANGIILGPADANTPVGRQSCVICTIGNARTCYNRIRTTLENGQPLIVTVTLTSDDCMRITWD